MHLLLILPYYLLQQPQKNKIRTLNSSHGYKSWVALIVVCGHYQGVFRYVPTYYDIPIDRQYYSTPFCMYLCRMKTALLLGIDQLGPPYSPLHNTSYFPLQQYSMHITRYFSVSSVLQRWSWHTKKETYFFLTLFHTTLHQKVE